MVKIKFIKKSKRMMSVIAMPLLIAIGISLFHMNKQLEEKQRNREYEVSLVKTLKNSYEGIEEIENLIAPFLQTHGELMSKLHLLMGLQSNTN